MTSISHEVIKSKHTEGSVYILQRDVGGLKEDKKVDENKESNKQNSLFSLSSLSSFNFE